MSVIDPIVVPQSGATNTLLSAAFVAAILAFFASIGWAVYKMFQYLWPKTIGKTANNDEKAKK